MENVPSNVAGKYDKKNSSVSLDLKSSKLKNEIVWMIIQYLKDEGLYASSAMILDELGQKAADYGFEIQELKSLTGFILDGDWATVEVIMAGKTPDGSQQSHLHRFTRHSGVQYAVYRQQFLESVEKGDTAKSLQILNEKLKPVEFCAIPGEFKDFCYFLTGRNVHGLPGYRGWEGTHAGREALVRSIMSLYKSYDAVNELGVKITTDTELIVPPKRLESLFEQAVQYQVLTQPQSSIQHSSNRIETLLEDYRPRSIPSELHKTFKGHSGSIKSVTWIDSNCFASGSSDYSVIVWNHDTGEKLGVYKAHDGRIWDLSVDHESRLLASASSDGTVCLWNTQSDASTPLATITSKLNEGVAVDSSRPLADTCPRFLRGTPVGCSSYRVLNRPSDVYSCEFRPPSGSGNSLQIACGYYDKSLSIYDVSTQKLLKELIGHEMAVSHVCWSQTGNLLISGGKDCSIRFWDATSGVNVKSIFAFLGEVTSLDMHRNGIHMLSSSKDSSHRLWDLRQLSRPLKRYRGHQNTFKNIIKASFAGSSLIVSGSENGHVFIWDQDTESLLLQKPVCRSGVLYKVSWNPDRDLYVACGDDCSAYSFSSS